MAADDERWREGNAYDVWVAVRELPLVLEGVVWLLAFPFLAGLAIWQAPWEEPARIVAIVLLAVAYTSMFIPRNRGRASFEKAERLDARSPVGQDPRNARHPDPRRPPLGACRGGRHPP
jgi:hypothetical protein